MNIFQSNGRATINGVEIDIPAGSSITVTNNHIFINGKSYNDKDSKIKDKEIVQIVINGDVGNVESDIDVICKNVNGSVNCGRDCDISGDVTGNVSAGRDIDCHKIGGSANAGRDICY